MKSKIAYAGFVVAALVSGSIAARAADMPAFSKAPIAEPGLNWSGFYVGLQGGGGWGTVEDSATTVQSCPAGVCGPVTVLATPGLNRTSLSLSGFHGGGTAGFNFQYGQVVFGFEGDFSGANIEGSGACNNSFSFDLGFQGIASCKSNISWFGTATGRLGLTVDRALVFIKAGGAWAHFNQSVIVEIPTLPNFVGTSTLGSVRSGVTVGMGIEYAISHNLSAKVEYDYLDFGTKNLTYAFSNNFFGPSNLGADERDRIHLVKAGLNYRFNGLNW